MKHLHLAIISSFTALLMLLSVSACNKRKGGSDSLGNGDYPDALSKIFINKCAQSCHNAENAKYSADLNMATWDALFDGGFGGAVVIPGDPKYSTLLQYINTHDSSIVQGNPLMPLNEPPLSQEEYQIVKQWILDGAPDKDGKLPFSENAESRQKIYITQQGTDLLAVIDAKRQVVMKYLRIGADANQIESAHCFRADKQGRYGYLCFLAGNEVQKVDLQTDEIVGRCQLNSPNSQWNVLSVSDDGQRLIVTDLTAGFLAFINTADMSLTSKPLYGGNFRSMHGVAALPSFDTFFITNQYGNVIYRVTPGKSPAYKIIPLNSSPQVFVSQPGITPDPHEVILSPDNSKLFVTCQNTNEVRVIDVNTLQLIKVLNVGATPKELAISLYRPSPGAAVLPYVFVSCQEDPNSSPRSKGSVYVFNYETLNFVAKLDENMYQPHGVSVDDERGLLYVASINSDANGPAPHHPSVTGGRNGYYSVYDINTMKLAPATRYEVTEFPYSSDTRFKKSR